MFVYKCSCVLLRFQVTGLIEGQWYAYRVRAFNKLGASRPCRATDEIQAVDARGGWSGASLLFFIFFQPIPSETNRKEASCQTKR